MNEASEIVKKHKADVTSELRFEGLSSQKRRKHPLTQRIIRLTRGRPDKSDDRLKRIKALFEKTGETFLNYDFIKREAGIKSPTQFYGHVASGDLRPHSEEAGKYCLAKPTEKRDEYFEMMARKRFLSKWVHRFNFRNTQLFIPRPLRPDDAMLRALRDPRLKPSDAIRYNPHLEADKHLQHGAILLDIEPKAVGDSERQKIFREDTPKIWNLMEAGSMPLNDFLYLLPEALIVAYESDRDKVLGAFDGIDSLSDAQIGFIRKTAFGKAKRVRILYTVDVDELFKLLKENEEFKRKVVEKAKHIVAPFRVKAPASKWKPTGRRCGERKPVSSVPSTEDQLKQVVKFTEYQKLRDRITRTLRPPEYKYALPSEIKRVKRRRS